MITLKRSAIVLVSASLIACAAAPAMATLIAYEPFIGTGELTGQNTGGTGFTGGWTGLAGVDTISADNTGVAYTDANGKSLVQSGHKLIVKAVNANTGDITRTLASTVAASGTYYMSAVVNQQISPYGYMGIEMANTDHTLGLIASEASFAWYGFDTSGNGPLVPATKNVSTFLVAKIVKGTPSGEETVTLWKNPLLGDEAGSGLGETATIPNMDVWPKFGVVSYVSSEDNTKEIGYIADVRLGTTFNDVTPIVPEPSALILVVLGLSGLLAYAWRSRR